MTEPNAQELKDKLRRELAALTALDGISGHEQSVVEYLRREMEPLADQVTVDPLGNLYAARHGAGRHLMIEAHSDEIGALVAAIDPEGFIRFEAIGGVSPSWMVGRKVRVAGHRGVVGVRPGHLQSAQEARSVPDIRELYIDLGLDSREAVTSLGIAPGDQITWQSELEQTANPDRVIGKAIDNRIGCVILLELLRRLHGQELPCSVTFVVAVQEEVGLKGARVAAERLRPDCALVVDTTPCPDTPDSRAAVTFPVRLGAGPVLQVSSGDRGRGFILPDSVRRYLVSVAKSAGVPYQLAPFAFGNTDASAIYDSAGGIPTAIATIPRRYSHSPVEMLDLNDALATLRLGEAIVWQVEGFPTGLYAIETQ